MGKTVDATDKWRTEEAPEQILGLVLIILWAGKQASSLQNIPHFIAVWTKISRVNVTRGVSL